MSQPRPRWPLVTGVALLAAFVALAILLAVDPTPFTGPLDDAWRRLVGATAPVGGPLVWVLEEFGYWLGYKLLGLFLLGFLLTRRWWTSGLLAGAAVFGPGLLSQGTKNLLDRPRPAADPEAGLFGPWVGVDHGSYPSGHSMAMALAVTVIAIVVPPAWRRWWLPVAALLCLAMMWQRTLQNAHWLTDTIGGVAGGVGVTLVVWWLLHAGVEVERDLSWRPPRGLRPGAQAGASSGA
jgi:undecaprenyl-diphosphatase